MYYNNNNSMEENMDSSSRKYRQSDPISGRDNASYMSSQHQLKHQPLSKSNSDTIDASTVNSRNKWKITSEQLGLRRRLPRADLEMLVDVLGQERLRNMRSIKRRGDLVETYNDTSRDSLKMRTIEPPRKGEKPHIRMSNGDDHVLDLSYLFRGSLKDKSWAKENNNQSRAQLHATQTHKLSGWEKWKVNRSQSWKRTQRKWREILSSLEIWQGSFKTIEGNFGTSVTSYFRFLKWLLRLNFIITLLMLGVVVLTQAFMDPDTFEESIDSMVRSNETSNRLYIRKARLCTDKYDMQMTNITNQRSDFDIVLDVFQGTGFMEQTALFYGYYFNKTYEWVDSSRQNYNMPVAYIMATAFYFLVSLFLMVRYTAKGLKDSQLTSGDKFYSTCNKIFCSWDYSLVQAKAASYKHRNIYDDIKTDLEEQYRIARQKQRTTSQKCKLYSLRIFVNLFVIIFLGGACFLIYYSSIKTLELTEDENVADSGILILIIQFLPSLTITILNVIVPFIFEKLALAEDYSPAFHIKITIARTVILRLASIAVLVATLASRLLNCDDSVKNQNECGLCVNNLFCWETYVGQQFYKLVVLDFFVIVLVTFLVQYPRKLIVKRYGSRVKLVQMVGDQEFEIPKNVLDLVYTQTLCWLGAFYSPLIPAITVMKLFIFFYVKKISLLQTCKPSSKTTRASGIQSFFMTILILSIVLCIIPIVYTITKVSPSQSCGPFRIWDSQDFRMYEVVGQIVSTLPSVPRQIFYFLGTWSFYAPLYIVLCLFIYYYVAVAAGNRKMVALLKDQLALEGKDKQFLLGQVREALIRGELNSNSS